MPDQPTPSQPVYRFYVDKWSRQYCFSCPLDDCVGHDSQQCPIYQAKAEQSLARWQAERRQSPSPNGRGARGEGTSPNGKGLKGRSTIIVIACPDL